MQGTLGRLTQILRASSIVTTGSDEYVDLMGNITGFVQGTTFPK